MDSIVINEAVELAKKYAGEEDYQFINGVLGAISREAHSAKADEPAGPGGLRFGGSRALCTPLALIRVIYAILFGCV